MIRKLCVIMMSLSVLSLSAFGSESEKKNDKVAKALLKYTETGEEKLCISVRRVKTSRVLDDKNILFIMKGKKAYLNTLPRKCGRLGFEKAFGYRLHNSRLCNVDLITVIDTMGMNGPTCGLGKFKQYEKKPKKVAEVK